MILNAGRSITLEYISMDVHGLNDRTLAPFHLVLYWIEDMIQTGSITGPLHDDVITTMEAFYDILFSCILHVLDHTYL